MTQALIEAVAKVFPMSFLTDSAISFFITASALLASPGPATMALAASGAAYGFKRSLMFYSGIMVGLAISISLVASGIFLLVQKIPILATGLGLVSAAYIVLLAWSIARTPPSAAQQRLPYHDGMRDLLLVLPI
jgi:threonine/homoserine/homoserine lactone efflux protein